MSNTGSMPKMGDGLTTADIEQIQADSQKNTQRRINEAREDGAFQPTFAWKGMEAHLREGTPEYEQMQREKTKLARK